MIGRLCSRGSAAFLTLFAVSGLAYGQQTDPKLWEEIQALKRGQEEIRRQLLEIRQLLQVRQAPAAPDVRNMPVDLGTHPIVGSLTAALTLIEFSDYQCPYCGRHTKDVNPQLQKEYVDTGKVRYISSTCRWRIHKWRSLAGCPCAGSREVLEMHNRLFANQQKLEPWGDHAKAST
jgi:hypothetical protein